LTVATAEPGRYTRTAVLMHWLVAILVIGLLCMGFYMTGLDRNTPQRGWWFNLHKSIGVIALLLIVVRLAWRLTHPAPRLPESMPRIEKTAAHVSHWGLYVCMSLQALSGFVSSSLNRYGIKVFGLPLPKWGVEAPALREALVSIHHVVAWVLAALVIVHIAAAFKHALWDRDGVMRRMTV
jgi:cytochrome b561